MRASWQRGRKSGQRLGGQHESAQQREPLLLANARVQPRGVHTHTIIMLHPAGATAETYIRLYRRFGALAVHYRFVFQIGRAHV